MQPPVTFLKNVKQVRKHDNKIIFQNQNILCASKSNTQVKVCRRMVYGQQGYPSYPTPPTTAVSLPPTSIKNR